MRITYIFVSLILLVSLIACDAFIPQSTPESTMKILYDAVEEGRDFEYAFWSLTTDDAIVYKYPLMGVYWHAEGSFQDMGKVPFSVRYSKRFQNMAEVSWGGGSRTVVVMEKQGLKWYISCVTDTIMGVDECYR